MAIELQRRHEDAHRHADDDHRAASPGFFEAPWLFERNDTYYLAYAANNAGPTSSCTPANYHACIAYSTALEPDSGRGRSAAGSSPRSRRPRATRPSPSSTASGSWRTTRPTPSAATTSAARSPSTSSSGTTSRRPPRILPVETTPERGPDLTPRSNVAPWATSSASNEPIPTQYWIKSLNDELIRPNPLPPDMWGSWSANRPPQQWIQYDWDEPVRVDRARIKFWRDVAPGTGNGVSDPSSWSLQYWAGRRVARRAEPERLPDLHDGSARRDLRRRHHLSRLRAVLNASPNSATPPQYSALAVEEWEVHQAQPAGVAPVAVSTVVGVHPSCPRRWRSTTATPQLGAPVRWDADRPGRPRGRRVFTVQGFAEGYAAGAVEATVTVLGEDPWRTNLAPTGTPQAEFTAGGTRSPR